MVGGQPPWLYFGGSRSKKRVHSRVVMPDPCLLKAGVYFDLLWIFCLEREAAFGRYSTSSLRWEAHEGTCCKA